MSSVCARAAATVCALACLLGGPAAAQVLEVGADGATTVYDRPMTFSADGARPILPPATPRTAPAFAPALTRAAMAADLSPELIEAVAWRESRFRPRVVSAAGAIGEMQLMPGTARDLGVDPWDTVQNYQGGARYLRAMLERYDGDVVRALAAYNAGPGAVDRHGGVPPYRETQAYVAGVLEHMSRRVAVEEGR